MTTHLYIDPLTARIVYQTTGAEFPTKSMVLDDGKLRLFAPNTVVKLDFAGTLPTELNNQNAWDYRVLADNQGAYTVVKAE